MTRCWRSDTNGISRGRSRPEKLFHSPHPGPLPEGEEAFDTASKVPAASADLRSLRFLLFLPPAARRLPPAASALSVSSCSLSPPKGGRPKAPAASTDLRSLRFLLFHPP